MAKKKGLLALVFVLIFSFALVGDVVKSFAVDVDVDATFEESPLRGPFRKFSRGFCNIIFCWLEIGQTTAETCRKENIPVGLTYGALKGILFSGVRLGVGLYEVVTFPVPLPKNYEPIFKEPEFYPGEGEGLK